MLTWPCKRLNSLLTCDGGRYIKMSTNYYIACIDSFEFIHLHKWPIIDDVGHRLHRGRKLAVLYFCASPAVIIDKSDIIESIDSQASEDQQGYIKKLIPFVRDFVSVSGNSHFFITCDIGDLPWEIGSSIWYKWKEVIADFGFESHFLPRNLIDDFKLLTWDEVLEFYKEHDSWMLHEQLEDNLIELKTRYLYLLEKI